MQPDQHNREEQEWREYCGIFEAINDGLILSDLETGDVIEANPAAYRMHGYSHQEFIGLKPITFLHTDSQPGFSDNLHRLTPDGVLELTMQHVRRDGTTFFAEWRGAVFTYHGRSCLLSVVRDVSQQVEARQLLHQQVETHDYEQTTLLEISHTLASTLEFRPGMILDQLQKIVNYTHGGLFALQDSTLVALAMCGISKIESTATFRIHLHGSETLTLLFNEHQPICIADVWGNTPPARFLRWLLDDGAAVLLEGMQSWMWVPLAVKNRIIGGVGVAHENPDYFTPHHADLALSVANMAAITMANAELYQHAQELAVLEERQRLAHNLHDAINQSLFSAGLIAEVLPRLWERDQAEARLSIIDLLRLTRGAQAEMRALLAELRPSTLTDSDLGDLLRLLGNALSGRTNIPVTVNVNENIFLPAEVQITFYRVCQEALSNIAKHSKASQVEINLTRDQSAIELHIRDNGQGFDQKQTLSGHYGLSMMRERAEAVGALLAVTSQPGHGTEITIYWTPPLKEAT